ncbi:MAG: hypothetical protein PGN13_16310 [Patulibacter minatonensis]
MIALGTIDIGDRARIHGVATPQAGYDMPNRIEVALELGADRVVVSTSIASDGAWTVNWSPTAAGVWKVRALALLDGVPGSVAAETGTLTVTASPMGVS